MMREGQHSSLLLVDPDWESDTPSWSSSRGVQTVLPRTGRADTARLREAARVSRAVHERLRPRSALRGSPSRAEGFSWADAVSALDAARHARRGGQADEALEILETRLTLLLAAHQGWGGR